MVKYTPMLMGIKNITAFADILFTLFVQMFCTVCGNQISKQQCFCSVCGSKCPQGPSTVVPFCETEGKERVPTFSEFMQNRNSDFDNLSHIKSAERKDRFIPKKKKQGAEMVKVSGSLAQRNFI